MVAKWCANWSAKGAQRGYEGASRDQFLSAVGVPLAPWGRQRGAEGAPEGRQGGARGAPRGRSGGAKGA